MVRYKVPYDVIEKFCEKAGANKKNGHHIETLAFLVGFKEDDVITVTDMVFGQQQGNLIRVEDHGKFFIHIEIMAHHLDIWNHFMVFQFSRYSN